MPRILALIRGRRGALLALVVLVALLVACGPGGVCESAADRDVREKQARSLAEATQTTPTASATPATTATSEVAPVATAAASPTPSTFTGRIGIGYDHPPFAPGSAGVGGASVGLVCGAVTGAPAGSTIVINLTGGTGAPATVRGPLGADGGFTLPFPITSFGPITAAVGSVTTSAGAALVGSVTPVSSMVAAGGDLACAAR